MDGRMDRSHSCTHTHFTYAYLHEYTQALNLSRMTIMAATFIPLHISMIAT
jgi:hypothetical protein